MKTFNVADLYETLNVYIIIVLHDILYFSVTCVYLACKIEEFFIRMGNFIQNVNGNRKKAASIILDKEMTVIQKLNKQLAVWNPYTPVEGILLQLKV